HLCYFSLSLQDQLVRGSPLSRGTPHHLTFVLPNEWLGTESDRLGEPPDGNLHPCVSTLNVLAAPLGANPETRFNNAGVVGVLKSLHDCRFQ
ncbi:hypothetical protein SCAB_48573, partial [Streptomyces scabiei 87.22]